MLIHLLLIFCHWPNNAINCMYLKCLIWWVLIYVHACENITANKIMNIFIFPEVFFSTFATWPFLTHHPFSLCPKKTIDLLSVTIGLFSFSRELYNRIIKYTLLWVCREIWLLSLSVSIQNSFMLYVSIICSFLLLSSILLYGYTTMFLPILCRWTCELFPGFGYNKKAVMNICLQVFG